MLERLKAWLAKKRKARQDRYRVINERMNQGICWECGEVPAECDNGLCAPCDQMGRL